MITEDYFVNKSRIALNEISKEVLRVENLTTSNMLKNVSFSLKKGEIISITGSYGSGKCEIAYALFGVEKITGGKVYIDGKKIKIKNPSDAIKNKIGLVSYEKEENSFLSNLNTKENITISRLNSISHMKIIKKDLESFLVKSLGDEFGFEFDNEVFLDQLPVFEQRKVGIARAMSYHPKVLILVDPTKGLDNKSRKQILELLVGFSNSGISIILISSNIHEILQISNRVLLFSENTITGIINESELELKDQIDLFNNLI
jgi:ABC-type sugar transport system ATPase subunit